MANERARVLRRTMTLQEIRLWLALRPLKQQGLHFRRQVPRATFIIDFACLKARLAIEVDGEQHGLEDQLLRDARRDRVIADLGYLTLRFWNHEVMPNIVGVVETIVSHAIRRMAR